MSNKTVETNVRKKGDVVGNYRIIRLIALGGLARVYEVEHIVTTRRWAMKEYPLTGDEKHDYAAWLNVKAEYEALDSLRIREIPYVYDTFSTPDSHVIIMSLITGTNLYSTLLKNGPFETEFLREVGVRVCNVLIRLHEERPPFIYRDIKPSNIMLVKKEGSHDIAMIDFGTIIRKGADGSDVDEARLCTEEYASPEQLTGKKTGRKTDARSDIYCLGVTMYELLTKNSPTEVHERIRKDLHDEMNEVDRDPAREGMFRIIMKCIRPDPDKRFQTARDLKHAIIHANEFTHRYQSLAKAEMLIRRIGWPITILVLAAGFITWIGEFMENAWKWMLIPGGIVLLLMLGITVYLFIKNGRKNKSREFADLVEETDMIDDEELDGTSLLIKKERTAAEDPGTELLSAPRKKRTTSGRFEIKTTDVRKAAESEGE